MQVCFSESNTGAIAIELVAIANYAAWLSEQTTLQQTYLQQIDFAASTVQHALLFDKQQQLCKVVVTYTSEAASIDYLSALALRLPEGVYALTNQMLASQAYVGWAKGAYQFTRYKSAKRAPAQLYLPAELKHVLARVNGIYLTRDLINTPANDMGPTQLSAAMENLAATHNAQFSKIVDQELLAQNFPAIYTVGKASTDAPRLLELTWGNENLPSVTLVGKGVCFDSGGLNIKPDAGMRNMKKDMGGAANVLGLASHIMQENLPVYLRVLVPAVENAIAGNAMRPGDIITMRNGKTVEVDNTDAEGRLVLADTLTYATETKQPNLLLSFATLTGAARVAVGTEIAAYFTNDDALVASFNAASGESEDPIWQQPLYRPYARSLKTAHADLKSCGYGMGGAITATLFLEEFISGKPSWIHLDIMAWNANVRPGHPEGGEAMGTGAAFELIKQIIVSS
jgi:leucyl aminopeptidase